MNHRIFLVLFSLFCVWPSTNALAVRTMTLDQCLEAGIKENPTLMVTRFDILTAEADRKSARADFLPSLSADYSVNTVISESRKGYGGDTDSLDQDGVQFNLRMSQILYSGFRIFNAYERAKIHEKMFKAEMELKQLEVEYRIETTFYRLMKAKQDVISVQESVHRLKESVNAAQAFFDREQVAYVDVLQAQVDLADAQERLGISKNDVNRERAALFSLMNLNEDPDIQFSDQVESELKGIPPFETSRDRAFSARPDIKSLEFQLDIAKKDAKIAKGKYLPTVRMDIGYHDSDKDYVADYYNQRIRYWTAGVTASWQLFDGGRAFYEYQRHNIRADRIKALILDAKNTITTNIRRALYAMAEAKQRVEGSIKALDAAGEYYAGEEKRLKAGISTIPALLDAQDRLIRAQGNHTRAILDYRLAQSELKLMTGSLYDPNAPAQ